MRRQHRQIPPRANQHVKPTGGQVRIDTAEWHLSNIVTRRFEREKPLALALIHEPPHCLKLVRVDIRLRFGIIVPQSAAAI